MYLMETQRAVRRHLRFQLTRLHGDRHMIEKEKTGDLIAFELHYSNSTTTWPLCTLWPGATLIALILPATGDVTLVSIFMASRTSSTSPTCKLCPTCAVAR